MKNQRFVYGSVVEKNGILLFSDVEGKLYNLPELNEKGSPLYKRARAAANAPGKWAFKVRVVGTLKSGSLGFTRVGVEMLAGAEPVTNFDKPNGGLESYLYNSNPTTEPMVTNVPEDVLNFIHNEAEGLKPKMLFMNSLKWKYLVRNIIRGKNIMMTGPAGCGKTMAAKAAANSLEGYNTFIINLGATQDPRTTLIGNTQFDTTKGTVFNSSPFIKAIQTPNTVVVLDEITRAHPEAWNILMTVLDTATRMLDRAILDRFTIIEMDTLTKEEETQLLQMMYPSVEAELIASVAEITSMTRNEVKGDSPKLTNSLSTRAAVEIGSLLYDGFSLEEAAEITIYPFFEEAGGAQSERVYIKQFVQKFIKTTSTEDIFNVDVDMETYDYSNPF